MARSNSSSGFLGWMFGRKKSRSRTTKKSGLMRRLVWMFLVFVTGSGSIAGATEYDVIITVWKIVRERLHQHVLAPKDISSTESGAVRVYFTQPGRGPQSGDIAHAVVEFVDATERTLDVCAFELDNRIITEAIVRAAKRGVRVRFVTETDYLDESGVLSLRNAGVPIVDDQRIGALMHNKFMIFDKRAVWTGSMNFTENCAYKNNNHGIYIEDGRIVENYATKFSWMFEQRKFGSPPNRTDRIPNPVVKLADGTQIENYFSPHDRPATKVIESIKLAKKSIHFLAFSFTHDGIGQAMLSRASMSVEVAGVFEKTQAASGHSEYEAMRRAGLAVFLDANPRNMHHKLIVIDGEIVICGSFNFSENADKTNDENLLIIYNRAIAAKFEEEFQRVHQAAKQADGR